MPNSRDFGQLLQNVTTRAIQPPASRNRPLNLYVIGAETVQVSEDTATLTLSDTGTWLWTASGSTATGWGLAEWRSV